MAIEIGDAVEADLPGILAIQNHAIAETTAVWSYDPVTLESRIAWLADRRAQGFPVLAARGDGELLGFASYGPFRAWDAYRHTVENSVYVRSDIHRQGVGRLLLSALVERARAQDLHVMIAGIEAGNTASIALHARLGFYEAGRLAQVGAKFGRWMDLVLMQLALSNAPSPSA
jgi:L-amino acid N-acyltransferase YncA